MNEKKLVHNFKSYINVSPKNNGEKNGTVEAVELKPKLLSGEQVVGAAHNVVMLAPLCERDKGRYGSVFVTNYRLSFVPLENKPCDEYGQLNNILGAYDVPLTAVYAVWLTDGDLARRRRWLPNGDLPDKVKGLQVVCKNMKVMTLTFGASGSNKGRTIATALIHHAFPRRHDLLFAFDCKEPYYHALPADMNMFYRSSEWCAELERRGGGAWRVSAVNGGSDAFMRRAGTALVVPASVLDCTLVDTARHFRAGSIPVWVWGAGAERGGAALLRGGELLPTANGATTESLYLEQVRRSHPKLRSPHVIYLCGNSYAGTNTGNVLPPLAALQNSYKKLIDLCTPTTLAAFWKQDSQWYSLLEGSKWLRAVSLCLHFAEEAAAKLHDHCTVLLQEGEGVDYAAVVSSLTQLLLDPYFRTISGFQSLVQKEWLALGHPFCDRLGLPPPNPPPTSSPLAPLVPSSPAPVFLLFLDCTWQLTEQFPEDFEFNEVYLTTLWDSVHNPLLDTFIFNCHRDRELAAAKNFISRPVWDWGEQFSEKDIALFYNPLYAAEDLVANRRNSRVSKEQRLVVSCTEVPSLWSACYERWLGPLAAPLRAPYPPISRIKYLKKKLAEYTDTCGPPPSPPLPPAPPPLVSRFYPFSQQHSVTDICTEVSVDTKDLLDSQSLLNAPD